MSAAFGDSEEFHGPFDDSLIGLRLGSEQQLELRRMLGRGGMGAVFAARNHAKERECAIKFLMPERVDAVMKRRFVKEARKLAQIRHPNVVRVYALGKWKNCLYIESELIEGRNLFEMLKSDGALPLDEALRVVKEAALALQAVHEAELIHRDLKPENLMVQDADGLVRLIDFGIAKDLNASVLVTRQGEFLGTPGYTAPEQTDGRSEIDHRADIFALGVILFELITGDLAFDGRDTRAVLKASKRGWKQVKERARGDEIAPVADLLQYLMQEKPKHRPSSMTEVVRCIDDLGDAWKDASSERRRGFGERLRALMRDA